MNKNLIYDGNSIYEIDPECIRKKEENQKENYREEKQEKEEVLKRKRERERNGKW